MAAVDPSVVAQSDAAWERTVVVAYERLATVLWEYGRRLGRDRAGAEDVVQEAFARLVHLSPSRRPSNLAAWLFRTVHNLVIDEHRRGRRIASGDVEVIGDRRGDTDDLAQRLALWEAVDRLPLRQREVVFLRYRADLDFATIGSILGITESGARANAFRAIHALKQVAETWR